MSGLPEGLVSSRAPLELSESNVPAGLLRDHRLAPGRWGLLAVTEGAVTYVDQHLGETVLLEAPATRVIEPQQLHHLVVHGPFRATIDFYKRP